MRNRFEPFLRTALGGPGYASGGPVKRPQFDAKTQAALDFLTTLKYNEYATDAGASVFDPYKRYNPELMNISPDLGIYSKPLGSRNALPEAKRVPHIPSMLLAGLAGGGLMALASSLYNNDQPKRYAKGGEVSGRYVIDTDPNAETDSIPALVDGVQPARLDSGEFVIPEDVTQKLTPAFFEALIQAVRS
jgi:hypothetical protein